MHLQKLHDCVHLWYRPTVQSELVGLATPTGPDFPQPPLSVPPQPVRVCLSPSVGGTFDFNYTPLAPPNTKVLVHDKPANRASWDPHAVKAWYTRPAMYHYRCYQVWMW